MRTLGVLGLALLAITFNGVTTREPDVKDWYHHATFYQIYTRSFLDSNGDGVGDLVGITSKMKYLADIGIDAAVLSSPFRSPMMDFGYDVSDFYDIQPEYGNLRDFEKLVEEAHRHGIKLILEFSPNHSSDQNEWFKKSVAGDPEYSDFYVWRPAATGGGPPNNWISWLGGPAWTYNEQRGEYYLHQFSPELPDLNYRNPKVLAEMTKILFFWLDRGVDGFKLDVINHLFEDGQFRDEPPSVWGSLDHIYTQDLPDVYDVVYNWRDQMDAYSAEKSRTVILITKAYTSTEKRMLYYESADRKRQGAHVPFNSELISTLTPTVNAVLLKSSIDSWMNHMPARHNPNWITGGHDYPRLSTRVGPERVDQILTVLHTLPGTSFTYYGDEIVMLDFKEAQQFDHRDPNRTPMQWDSTISAGFSTNAYTWLRIHPNYTRDNVDVMQKNPQSTFHHFQHLTKLRRHRTMKSGECLQRAFGPKVYALLRELRGEDSFLTVLNMAGETDTVDLGDFVNLPQKMRVELAQPNSRLQAGNEVDISKLTLGPYDSVVLRALTSSAAAIKLSIGLLVSIMAMYISV